MTTILTRQPTARIVARIESGNLRITQEARQQGQIVQRGTAEGSRGGQYPVSHDRSDREVRVCGDVIDGDSEAARIIRAALS